MANQNTSETTPAQKRAARSNAGGRKSTGTRTTTRSTTSRGRSATGGTNDGGLATLFSNVPPGTLVWLNTLVATMLQQHGGQSGGMQATIEAPSTIQAPQRRRKAA